MSKSHRAGFTLIELLTVIAIIGILASFTLVGIGKYIEKANLTKMQNAMRQIQTAMVAYYGDNNSFPPAYGYVDWNHRNLLHRQTADPILYNLKPYMAFLGMHQNDDYYDLFSDSYDVNGDNVLSALEFSPMGASDVLTSGVDFPEARYNGDNLSIEVARQLETGQYRPLVYIPVNLRQFKRARRYWIENRDWFGETWNTADQSIARLSFPPESYDAFVLVSVGPAGQDFGVLTTPPEFVNQLDTPLEQRDIYHIIGLRAYFLATRDLNNNQKLDFDFITRSREGEGALEYEVRRNLVTNRLPDAEQPNGYGPLIWVFEN